MFNALRNPVYYNDVVRFNGEDYTARTNSYGNWSLWKTVRGKVSCEVHLVLNNVPSMAVLCASLNSYNATKVS